MKNIFKYIFIIQFATQPLFALDKLRGGGGGVKLFNESDDVTPREQAKNIKDKKDSCAQQGKVWAAGNATTKGWACYDPDSLVQTIKPEADPSCDEKFVNTYIASDGCFQHGSAGDCAYLAAVGTTGVLGAKKGSADTAFFKFLTAKNNDFLKRYQKVYEKALENSVIFKKMVLLNSQNPHTHRSENFYVEEHLRLAKKDPKLTEFILKYSASSYYSSPNLSVTLNKSLIELAQELIPEEYDKYRALVERYEADLKKIDPKEIHADEIDKLVAKKQALQEEMRTEGLSSERKNQLQYEIDQIETQKKVFYDALAKFRDTLPKRKQAFLDELKQKYPRSYLVERLRIHYPTYWYEAPLGKEEIAKARKNLTKRTRESAKLPTGKVAVGASLGLSLLGMPVMSQAASNQLQTCANNLNLSKEELDLLYESGGGFFKSSAKNVSGGSITNCQKFKLDNVNEVLTQAQAQFGFIPKGICALAQKSNKQFEDLMSQFNPTTSSCSEISGENFSLKIPETSDKGEFTCKSSTGKTYVMPFDLETGADYLKVKAIRDKGDQEDPLAKSTFINLAGGESYQYAGSINGEGQKPTYISRISDCLDMRVKVSSTHNMGIFCTCVKQAHATQAALQVMKSMPSCSRNPTDSSSPPASTNGGDSGSKTKGVRTLGIQ